jgi:hypothetical protein
MYRRWKSTYTVQWTPIITFTRRHLALLEWFEKNVDPIGFKDTVDSVGVALIASDLRVTVKRSEMLIESGLSGLEVENLLPTVTGILDVMEPRDIVVRKARSKSTVEIEGIDYSEACARFAVKCTSPPVLPGGFRPVDASVLADLDSESVYVQVEWGIVKRSELLDRLRLPIGRLGDDEQGTERRMTLREAHALVGDQAPQVSVLVDSLARRKTGGEAHDAESVGEAIENLDALGKGVSESLAADLLQGMGESQ